jgi:predicted ATPase
MLLEQIRLQNLLSFRDETIDLLPLNILIGENAAGKSNLIEIISLLQAAPTDLNAAILRGGGIRFWLWLGGAVPSPNGSLACKLRVGPNERPVNYELQLSEDVFGFLISHEHLTDESATTIYFERGGPAVRFGAEANLNRVDSVLARFKSPLDSTPTTRLGRQFEQMRIYREFQTGPKSKSRRGIASSSAAMDYLLDGGDNLAAVLGELFLKGTHQRIQDYLRRFCERFDNVSVLADDQLVRAYLQEQGLLEPVPSVRMSDGTLKFLCLLAVLLHPDPPPLVCIEEPEQGLHPEAIQIVAQAMVDASERMQLIVTTHSEALVDAFSDKPECVVVCERDFDGGTRCKRLSNDQLQEWLKRYTLGQLWRKGEIGGNRW